jgi:hypothetical protein
MKTGPDGPVYAGMLAERESASAYIQAASIKIKRV